MTLFTVLDPDQMMFRFQGANPKLMTSEIDEYLSDIQTILLDKNYRSTKNIISSSQQLISYNYSDLDGPYHQEFMKDVSGVREDGEAISFQMYPTIEAEVLAIAETIQEMISDKIRYCNKCDHGSIWKVLNSWEDWDYGGNEPEIDEFGELGHFTTCDCLINHWEKNTYSYGDFFIGARTRAQLGYLEGPLVRKGIKFINLCGGSFWQLKHIADVIAYLKLAYDTSDSEALKRVYNIPSASHVYTWDDKNNKYKAGDYCSTRYLGKEFLAKINNNFSKIDDALFGRDGWRYQTNGVICCKCNRKVSTFYGCKDCEGSKIISAYDKYGPSKAQDLQEFVWRLQDVLNQVDDMGQVIQVIIDDCYEKYLRATEGFTNSDESENGKLEDLRTVEDIASEYSDPQAFLTFVNENVKAASDAKDGNWDDYVILSTYHRLKGLERPVVFGTGWCEGIVLTKDGREEPKGLLPHTFSLTPPPQFGVLPGGGQSPIEDERCIGFVAISRAKDRVFLSGCERYREWQLFPSRFIQEAGIESE